MEEFDRKTMEIIELYGWQVIVVPNGRDSFGYTVGMQFDKHVELFMIGGLDPLIIHQLLNDVAVLDEEHLVPGYESRDILSGGLPIRLVECDPQAAEMFQALRYSRAEPATPFTALQVLWPDLNGLFPGDEGYDAETYYQPLFPVSEE